jgi:hypothetical protein
LAFSAKSNQFNPTNLFNDKRFYNAEVLIFTYYSIIFVFSENFNERPEAFDNERLQYHNLQILSAQNESATPVPPPLPLPSRV